VPLALPFRSRFRLFTQPFNTALGVSEKKEKKRKTK